MAKAPVAQTDRCPVYWLIQAQDRLQDSLGARRNGPAALESVQRGLNKKLRKTFPKACAIVVLDRVSGYTERDLRHILRVEVLTKCAGSINTQARIVKTDASDALKQELDGWESAARPANDRGLAFMGLRPGWEKPTGSGKYRTLVYQDAYQTLLAGEVVTLQSAMLQAVTVGAPPVESIQRVLTEVFAEMCDRFYRRSEPCTSATARDKGNETPCKRLKIRFKKGFKRWTELGQAASARRAVLSEMPEIVPDYYDPCDLIKQVIDRKLWPELWVGCIHGDLHGRNVLVGIVEGQAC